jgi:hypothetical protein
MIKNGIISHGTNLTSASWDLEEIFPVSVNQPTPNIF